MTVQAVGTTRRGRCAGKAMRQTNDTICCPR
jgi:hypothetical protein